MGQGKSSLAGFATERQHGFGQPFPVSVSSSKKEQDFRDGKYKRYESWNCDSFCSTLSPPPLA